MLKNLKLLITIILVLSSILRFYRVEELFIFSADEEHQLTLAQSIVKDFHPVWIGVSAADTGFYMGPFWVYFSAFWLWIMHGDPRIVAYIAAAIGVLTTFLVYLVGKKLFGLKAGLMGSFLYACLPLVVYFDRRFWNPAPTAILSLGLLFSIYQTKYSRKWWIAVAFLYGMVFHVHLSLVPFIVLAAYALVSYSKPGLKIALLAVFAFLLVVSPLIIFDYFHKLSNISTPLRVAQTVSSEPKRIDPVGHLGAFMDALGRLLYLPAHKSNADEILHGCSLESPALSVKSKPPPAIIVLSVLSVVLFLLKRTTWEKEGVKLAALWIIVLFISYLLLPNSPLEYYLLGLYPVLLLAYGYNFQTSRPFLRKYFLTGAFILAALGVYTVLTAKEDFGLSTKRHLVKLTTTYLDGKKFELREEGECHVYEGWRFLFRAYGAKPERASADETLGWLYPDEVKEDTAEVLVITTEKGVPIKEIPKNATIFSGGGYELYLIPIGF